MQISVPWFVPIHVTAPVKNCLLPDDSAFRYRQLLTQARVSGFHPETYHVRLYWPYRYTLYSYFFTFSIHFPYWSLIDLGRDSRDTAPCPDTLNKADRALLKPIKIRVIKLESPTGTISVLLTNLYNKSLFPLKEISSLYFKRWEVESYYRDEKIVLEIEKFHSKTVLGIQQELFAIAIMSVITRTLMSLASQQMPETVTPQFKNSIMILAAEAALLVPDDPDKSASIFKEVLTEILRVKYYMSKKQRASNPRICKKPKNKWTIKKKKVLAETANT